MLLIPKAQFALSLLLLLGVSSQKKSDNDDEGRPYEFSFTIEGEQHRHEKKDISGIIQGEFGFITADGVYHVTVYATDENGSFKILSMRNIKVSEPLDQGGKALSVGKQALSQKSNPSIPSASLPSATQPTSPPRPPTTRSSLYDFTTASTIANGCSGCGIVTKPPPGDLPFQNPAFRKSNVGTNNYRTPKVLPSGKSQFPLGNPQLELLTVGPGDNTFLEPNPFGPSNPQQPPGPSEKQPPNPQVQSAAPTPINRISEAAVVDNSPAPPQPHGPSPQQLPTPQLSPEVSVNPVESARFNQNPGAPPQTQVRSGLSNQIQNKPDYNPAKVEVKDGVIKIPGNTVKITDKYPNMVDGLPNGITEGDIKDLLYKFNYTVGFHGHYEKGLKSGAKIGGYFVNGRDGFSRVVTYVADENGYRPKFTLINLGLDSEDTPKEETEKTFGLKSFEFIWYPAN